MILKEISFGPLTFHLYGFLIGLAIFAGWYICKLRAKFYKIPPKVFEDYLLLIPLTTSILGARIYHVLDYWHVYQQYLISIFYIQNGGIGIWGAIIGAVVGLYIYSKIRSLSFLSALDLFAPALALGQAIGRIGNYINQEGFGPPTNLPWKVYIEAANRPIYYISQNYFHPTFFYEAILDLITFLILLKAAQKFKKPGQVFALYLILYALARFLTENWRIDTWTLNGLKISYLFSLASITIGVALFKFSSTNKSLDND